MDRGAHRIIARGGDEDHTPRHRRGQGKWRRWHGEGRCTFLLSPSVFPHFEIGVRLVSLLLLWTGPAKAQPQPGRDPRPRTATRSTRHESQSEQSTIPRTLAPASAEAARPRLKPSSLLAAVESSQVRQREPLSAPGAAVPRSKSSVQFSSRIRCCLFLSLFEHSRVLLLQLFFSRLGVSAPRIRSVPGQDYSVSVVVDLFPGCRTSLLGIVRTAG
jgi:hypothetical protein